MNRAHIQTHRGVRVIPVGQGAVHGILGVECHAGERKEEAEQQYKQNRILILAQ